jgi:hypothetical protein
MTDEPKKPLGAWFLWKEEGAEALEPRRQSSQLGAQARAKELGRRWRELSAAEQQPFKDRAARDRATYTQAMRDWVESHPIEARMRTEATEARREKKKAKRRREDEAAEAVTNRQKTMEERDELLKKIAGSSLAEFGL